MSGYKFNCRICHAEVIADLHPNVPVCDKCVRPIAAHLCQEKLGVDLAIPGVDQEHWMEQARFLMALAVKRWVPIGQRGLTTDMMGQPEVKRLGSFLDRT